MSEEFNNLWRYACRHGTFQQEKSELEHVYRLLKPYKGYLEIGSAEGGSLSVLGHGKIKVAYVDWDEEHTRAQRNEVIAKLGNVQAIHGNTHDPEVIAKAKGLAPFDAVFIDAGHEYNDAVQDAQNYGDCATKYIIFHDIQLEPVRAAFHWYVKEKNFKKVHQFINSNTYGMGIIEK